MARTQTVHVHNPSSNTWKIIGVGALALFLLSKVKIGGSSITEQIGSGAGGIVQSTLGGVGDVIGGTLGGAAKGVLWEAPAHAGTTMLTPFVNLWSGSGTGERMAKTGHEVIDAEGLNVIFWTKDRIRQYMQPNATKIVAGSGYKTSSGYTYIAESSQQRAGNIQRLLAVANTPGDAAYMLAVQEGRDVSRWNMNSLSDEFKNTLSG